MSSENDASLSASVSLGMFRQNRFQSFAAYGNATT